MNKTRQGVRDLNGIGNIGKEHLNGRRDKGQDRCFHIWEDRFDENYSPFKVCQRCGFEDDGS